VEINRKWNVWPKSALRMLKSRMGVPIEEATPTKIKSLLKG